MYLSCSVAVGPLFLMNMCQVDEEGNTVPGTGGNMFDTGHQRRGDVVAEGGRVMGGVTGVGKSAMVGNGGLGQGGRSGGKVPPDGYVCNK